MDKKISTFLKTNKLFSFCTTTENEPYCASCFYAFADEGDYLVFKSSKETKHITDALLNPNCAGTITPDIDKVATIKGIQFTGTFLQPQDDLLDNLKKVYYKKFPFALTMPGDVWAVQLNKIKMTDNTLGFGKKLHWERGK